MHDNVDSLDVGLNALGRTTHFEYDRQGRQTARILPLGQREKMAYNAAGELIERRTFNGEVMAMSYDLAGHPDEVSLPDRTRAFAYTPSGQVREIVEGSDTWRFDYDARDRLIRAQDSAGRVIEYAHDAAGNRTELSTCASAGSCGGGQHVAYAYDALNRLREVVAQLPGSAPQTTEYRYDALGARSGMTHPNGTVVEYRYDLRHRLQTLVHQASAAAGAAVLLALSYTVDASGLRTQIAENRPGDASTPTFTRTTDYAYDAVKRLVREEVSGNHGNPERVHAWTYDAVGNRQSQVATIGTGANAATTTTSYAYDANDRLQTESAVTGSAAPVVTTSEYDNAGNLTETRIGANTEPRYTWDAEGRLVGAILGHSAAQKTIAYRYDPNGIRRSQQMTEALGEVTRTEYLVDPNQAYAQVLEEWTASATGGPLPDETLATTYVYGDDLISQTQLALVGAATTSVYHYDGLGTTRALSAHKMDAAGTPQAGHGEITDRYAYTAFGELDPAGTSGDTSGSTENNYRYTGEQLDPNLGFYYLRARYMDPGRGRFLGMDVFDGFLREPLSLHRLIYASLDPIGRIDPSGKVTLSEVSSALQTMSRLALKGASHYTNFIEPFAISEDSERETVWDMLMALLLRGFATDSLQAAVLAVTAAIGPAHEHHVIPIYMCGKNTANQSTFVPIFAHRKIHAELDLMYHAVNILGRAVTFSLRRNQAAVRGNKTPMQWAARTQAGRAAIYSLLNGFYSNGSYLGAPYSSLGVSHLGTARPISSIMNSYGLARYVPFRTDTSWSRCRR